MIWMIKWSSKRNKISLTDTSFKSLCGCGDCMSVAVCIASVYDSLYTCRLESSFFLIVFIWLLVCEQYVLSENWRYFINKFFSHHYVWKGFDFGNCSLYKHPSKINMVIACDCVWCAIFPKPRIVESSQLKHTTVSTSLLLVSCILSFDWSPKYFLVMCVRPYFFKTATCTFIQRWLSLRLIPSM